MHGDDRRYAGNDGGGELPLELAPENHVDDEQTRDERDGQVAGARLDSSVVSPGRLHHITVGRPSPRSARPNG